MHKPSFQNLSGSRVVPRLTPATTQLRAARLWTLFAVAVFYVCSFAILAIPGGFAYAQTSPAASTIDVSDSLYGTSSSTIRDLLRTARRQVGMGQLEAAGITLERALAIQPDNAVLWNALARLRYRQAGFREVRSLTLRSESLASGNTELVLRNRQLAAAADVALTGNVVPIAELDLQTPDPAMLNSPSVVMNNGTTADGALPRTADEQSGTAGINTPGVIVVQPLPNTSTATSRPLPTPTSPANVEQPRVVGSTTVYNTQIPAAPMPGNNTGVVTRQTTPGVVSRPAPQPVPRNVPLPTSRPSWDNQTTVVTPPPTQRTQPPAVASSSGIEERSFNHYGKGGRGVPRQYLPPPGMCRLWFDNRDASAQPGPGDCRALRRNVPPGARLIVGEHRYSWDPFKVRN